MNAFNFTMKASQLVYSEWTMRCVAIFLVLMVAVAVGIRIAIWWKNKDFEVQEPEDDEFFFGAVKDWREMR